MRFTLTPERDGQALVLVALFGTVLLGGAALTVDVGLAHFTKERMQAAADAAALAAVIDLQNPVAAEAAALEYARLNGFENGVDGCTVTCTPNPDGNANRFRIQISRPSGNFFSRILNPTNFVVTVQATAEYSALLPLEITGGGAPGVNGVQNLSVFGPYAPYTYGDPYSVQYLDNGNPNPSYRPQGYDFYIHVPENYHHNKPCGPDGVPCEEIDHDVAIQNSNRRIQFTPDDSGDRLDNPGDADEFLITLAGQPNAGITVTTRSNNVDRNTIFDEVGEEITDQNGFKIRLQSVEGNTYRWTVEADVNNRSLQRVRFNFPGTTVLGPVHGSAYEACRTTAQDRDCDAVDPGNDTPIMNVEIFDPDTGNNNGSADASATAVDEIRSPPGSPHPGLPSGQSNITQTRYQLFAPDDTPNDISDDTLIATATYGTNSGTDMKWVTPSGFQIDVTDHGPGNYRLNVKAMTGASENGFNLRAGPPGYDYANPNNTPELFNASMSAVGFLPTNFNQSGVITTALGRIPAEAATLKVHVNKFDTDVGAKSVTYSDELGNEWSGTLSSNGTWKEDVFTVPADYPGSMLFATYTAGNQDTSVWYMYFEGYMPGQPGRVRLVD